MAGAAVADGLAGTAAALDCGMPNMSTCWATPAALFHAEPSVGMVAASDGVPATAEEASVAGAVLWPTGAARATGSLTADVADEAAADDDGDEAAF